jgi:hypothetical protein
MSDFRNLRNLCASLTLLVALAPAAFAQEAESNFAEPGLPKWSAATG